MTRESGAGQPIGLIDCDAYLGRHPRLDVGANDPAAVLQEMDRTGIQTTVLAHHQAIWHSAAIGNDTVVRLTDPDPRLLPCWVMLPESCAELPPAAEYVAQARERGVVAFRACPQENVYDLLAAECGPPLAECERAGMPMLIDADQVAWADIDTIAHRFPDLQLVVCRVGYRTLRQAVGVLDRTQNVHCDLANLTSQGAIAWLTSRFGAHRLVFGTATPVRDPGEAITNLLWSEISDEEVAAIGHQNTHRLFGIRSKSS